jgi:hypothetical protein
MRSFYVLLLLICVLPPASVWADFYQYRDQNGFLHFTDNIANIPEDKRSKIDRYTTSEDVIVPEEGSQRVGSEALNHKEAQPASSVSGIKEETETIDANEYERLGKIKAILDEEYAELIKQKQDLLEYKETITSLSETEFRDYKEKVTRLNQRIAIFEKRRRAFKKKADAYNARPRK